MPEITVTTRKVIPVGSFNCELIMGNATDTSGGTFKVFSLSDIYATFAFFGGDAGSDAARIVASRTTATENNFEILHSASNTNVKFVVLAFGI